MVKQKKAIQHRAVSRLIAAAGEDLPDNDMARIEARAYALGRAGEARRAGLLMIAASELSKVQSNRSGSARGHHEK